MIVSVKLFGPEAAACGVNVVDIDVPDRALAGDVLRSLGHVRPELRQSLSSLRLAINHAFAAPDQSISASDELAIIGLVSGG